MTATALISFEQSAYDLCRSKTERTAVAATLVTRPGEWALLGQWRPSGSARQAAYSIRNGLSGWQMFGSGFEAETVTMLGEHRVYARYVGPAADAEGEQP